MRDFSHDAHASPRCIREGLSRVRTGTWIASLLEKAGWGRS
jgi:hypothetical protein